MKASTMRLNHLDLPVPDVAATAAFFTTYLDFRLLDMRGRNALAVLQGEDGFTLVLQRRDPGGASPVAPGFHIGFLVDSPEQVQAVHARLQDSDLPELGAPGWRRGAFAFYFQAPGGVLVEVSHRPPAAKNA